MERRVNRQTAQARTSGGTFLSGGGEMGELMRAHQWADTPLGILDRWPQSLCTAVSILLNSKYPMFIGWGPELLFFYNDAYRPILGATKHPVALGRPMQEIWSEIWDIVGPLADRAVKDGEPTWSDDLVLMMNRYGFIEETYFTFSYSPIRDETGGVGGMFCACTETTGTVIGDRRLRNLHDLAISAADATSVTDAKQRCIAVIETNPVDTPFALFYRLQANGKMLLTGAANAEQGQAIAPETLEVSNNIWPFSRVMRGQTVVVNDLSVRFDDVPLSSWADPVETALLLPVTDLGQVETNAIYILGINPRRPLDDDYHSYLQLVANNVATAVSNANAFEQEHQRAQALAELDRAKTDFFSNVSHEFRTPLTLMLGPIEETLRHTTLTGRERDALDIAFRNGLRLLRLVNSLLDFSRVEAGRIQARYEATDLAAVTTELANNFHSACDSAGLQLDIVCPALPEPVYVDPDMWEKIVLNLVSNAFKFTFEGTISVAVSAVDGHAELTVRDTGTGISASELPHIFERFHRVPDAVGRTHEGSGIGLALIQELVHLHGGSVAVTSTEGKGSTFTVRLPFGIDHLPADRIGSEPSRSSTGNNVSAYVEEALRWLPEDIGKAANDVAPPPASPDGARRPRILLADDNADMRQYVRRLLADHYDVEAVEDGQAALEAARASPPDLVLSDVMMPRLDGFGLLRALRADPDLRHIPVIHLSARAGENAQVEGLEADADD